MKLLKIVVATTMVIAFATSVFASVCEEAPEIVEFFDRYLIVKNDLTYGCVSEQLLSARVESLLKIDTTKDLVFSNEKIPVPLTFPTDSPKSFIHAKTDNGSRISSLIYDKPTAIQWYNGEIVKSDFEWLADDFKAYLGSVNALGDLWQIYKPEIAPGLSAEFFEANKFILLKGNDDLPDNQRIDFDDESGLYLAINDTGRHVTSEIFMVAPNKVVFDYNQGYRTWYGIMGDESAQVYHFFITLNYAAPRGIEKDDYLNYELESISFDLSYDPHCAYSFAPQTGVDAVAYTAVAVVALAAAAVVVKKRRFV